MVLLIVCVDTRDPVPPQAEQDFRPIVTSWRELPEPSARLDTAAGASTMRATARTVNHVFTPSRVPPTTSTLLLQPYDNIVFFIMTHPGLGEFEQLVLLAIAHLQGEAYGIPIVQEIERRTGRRVSRAAVYITMRRLEEKGLVSSWMSDPTPERGGKARRYARLETEGARALREARQVADRMWRGLDPASLKVR